MEFRYLFQFYIACLLLNIVALPICYKLFGRMRDGGVIVGKTIGLYLCGYLMWLLSSCHILKFSTLNSILCILLVAICCYGPIAYSCIKYTKSESVVAPSDTKSKTKYKSDNATNAANTQRKPRSVNDDSLGFFEYIKANYRAFIIGELIFFAMFLALNWIFAHRIPGSDTERMMDLGFMNSIYITDYMPPMDMWSAGKAINYYYFGQYIITYLTKISFIPVGYGYTFGLYLIAAWVFTAVFRLVQTISGSRVAGVLSSVAVVFAGNVHYIVFSKIVPFFWDILQLEGEKPSYWFANSTRYIGYVPEVEKDKTIHEFPSYSFIIGDLHAHVVDLLIVVTILTLLWVYLCYIKENVKKDSNLLKTCVNPYTVLIAFLLGISSMSNYWDLPIYYVVAGSIILFGMISTIGLCKEVPFFVGLSGIFIYMLNLLVALPFNLKFDKMVEGIGVVSRRSLLHQYLFLWGFPVILSAIFIAIVLKKKRFNEKILYVILLALCATGLTLIPEFVFVKDIYIDGFPRANTMFKLSYEAFVMFGIVMGCMISYIYKLSKEANGFEAYQYKKIAVIALLILLWTSCYSITAIKSWIRDYSSDNWQGFDASKTIRENNSLEMNAIDSLVEIVEASDEKQPVVLEADGDSYTNTCKVSVLTGYPTVLGWHTHEWLWHNSHSYMESRRIDVESIYSGEDIDQKKSLVEKYGIDYIYVGLKEYEKYEIVQNYLLEQLGEVVYCEACDSGEIIEIIKVTH